MDNDTAMNKNRRAQYYRDYKKNEKHLTSISSAEYWRDNVYYNVQ
jgi:hypothetical protein